MNPTCPPEVERVFRSYPDDFREKLLSLRELIFETAQEIDGVGALEETLKWGEPAYLAKGGSTIRIGWKKSRPGQYAMYFNCNSALVDTFKELYGAEFDYEGNRAIVFQQNDDVAARELKHCIALSLRYHSIKHLPMLGA